MPAIQPGFVRRPAIVSRLVEARDSALALIVAPAGYGKSALLAEWAACDQRPFIWIELASVQADAPTLWTAIAQAFDDMGWLERGQRAAIAASCDGDTSALRSLVRSLHRTRRGFVLVLDDAHTVRPSALTLLVMGLLDQLGEGAQIALASRSEPQLPIGRLRGHRALVEVRTEDLRFAPAEAAALLRLAGLELDFRAVQALSTRTEGWPVGLYLAALSLREQTDPAAGVRTFAGDDHRVAEYFRDEFLAELSPALATFLIQTSVLDDLSGPLCDAVLERSGSAATLVQIARSHLMLVPLERNDEWFRCPDLFRAMLRAELRQSAPRLVPRLHGRASVWLEQQGDLDGAIGHAVAAGDADRAGDLLWEHIAEYLTQGRNETVQAWLDAFSAQQIAGSAPLALSAAHSCLMAGDPNQARHWGLLAADADQHDSAAATRSLETASALIDAAAPRRSVSEMAQAAERAYTLEPDHSPWRPMCCWLRGIAEHLAGRPHSAEAWLEEGIALSAGEPSIASLCLAQLAVMAIGQDDWQSADELAERAAEIATRPLLAASPMSALVFAVLAATRAQQGHVDHAKRELRHGTDLLAELGDLIPWYAAETRLMLALAAIRLADTVRARTLLAEASRLARRTPDAVIFKPCFDRAWARIDTLAETALSGPSSLTIAELRILRFLPSHRSFREIAERLDVSVNTVKTQAHAIYRKLDAASRSEAVARASSAGLLGT